MTMPDYRTMYDRDYIGHFDLPGGNDLTLTMKRVIGGELTAMGGRKSKKPIVHFKEEGIKPLICNKTNAKTIAAMYGKMTEQWAGKLITLFVSTTRNPDGSGDVECIRIRPTVSNAADRPRAPVVHKESHADSIDDDSAAPSTASARVSSPATSALPPNAGPGADAPSQQPENGYISAEQLQNVLSRVEQMNLKVLFKARLQAWNVPSADQITPALLPEVEKWIAARTK